MPTPAPARNPSAKEPVERDGKTRDRTHEHDALNAEIENTRLLMNHDACRRDKERRAGI